MEKNNSKKFLVLVAIGFGFEFLVIFLTGLFGATPVLSGLLLAISGYFQVWANPSALAFICVGLYIFDIALLIACIVLAIKKDKKPFIVGALAMAVAIAFLPFLLLMAFPQLEAGNVSIGGMYILAVLMVMNIADIIFFGKLMKPLFKCCKKECQQESKANGLSEKEVRQIVEQYFDEHQDEFHKEAEEPAKEEVKEEQPEVIEPYEEPKEEVKEEPKEEKKEEKPVSFSKEEIVKEGEVVDEDEYEIVEVVDEEGHKVKIKRRRKASFETRLRGSEYDIRHKYYDLRDYIKWYGLSNRISIPGDSFSYKRKKMAFITIIGKRIKFYIALDPAKYEDSPIPVERATAKKYADTPCVLRIKSDLSYRRAKKLVDEAMKEAGIAKPEGEEPKETQHLDK